MQKNQRFASQLVRENLNFTGQMVSKIRAAPDWIYDLADFSFAHRPRTTMSRMGTDMMNQKEAPPWRKQCGVTAFCGGMPNRDCLALRVLSKAGYVMLNRGEEPVGAAAISFRNTATARGCRIVTDWLRPVLVSLSRRPPGRFPVGSVMSSLVRLRSSLARQKVSKAKMQK